MQFCDILIKLNGVLTNKTQQKKKKNHQTKQINTKTCKDIYKPSVAVESVTTAPSAPI